QPSHDVWNRITASLPPERAGAAGLWSSLNLWRGLAGLTSAAALACAVALFVLVRAPTLPPLVASIAASSQGNFVATIDPARGAVVVVPAAYAADPGRRPPPSAARPEPERVPELW